MLSMFHGALSDDEREMINQIYLDYNDMLYRQALKMLRDVNDAQDAVAQTYLNISEHMKKIRELPENKVPAYCMTIVINASTDIFRRRKRLICVDEVEPQELNEFSDIGHLLVECENKERLFRAIEKLSRNDRILIQLRYVYYSTYKEIARLLNITEDAARKRGQRILKKLRVLYEEEEKSGR